MQENGPSSELDRLLLDDMCIEAAKGVKLQCQRKYWGASIDNRTLCLNKFTKDQLENLATNNVPAEQYLATFGYLASQSELGKWLYL